MAITRAQQAKQMLQDGGMLVKPGFGGKRQGYRSARAQEVQGRTTSAVDTGDLGSEKANVAANVSATTGKGRQDPMGGREDLTAAQIRAIDPIQFGGPTKSQDLFTGGGEKEEPSFFEKLKKFTPPARKVLYNIFPNDPKNELSYIANLKLTNPTAYKELPKNLRDLYEETEEPANEFMSYKDFPDFSFEDFEALRTFQPTDGLNFAEYAAKYKGAPGLLYAGDVGGLTKIKNPDGTFRYERRPDDKGGGISDLEARLKLLEEEKAKAAAGTTATDEEKIASTFQPNFRLMAEGGMAEREPYEGGIMDLESARQMYGLGKLVKKVTRSVKKIAKSPLGKVAIGAALFNFGAPLLKSEGLKKFFLADPRKGFQLSNLIGKGLTTKGALTGIAGISTLAGLMTPQQEEEDDEQSVGADLPLPVEAYLTGQFSPNIRLAAEGGIMRAGYQEGSKEPVAKKTMPLLDMGGMEKDYREEGGFVPIGRMEKADDVPARLSKNEFVFTADAVRNAGDGDVDLGAEKMYNMMKNLEAGGDVSEESQGLEGARKMFQTSQRLEEVI